MVHTFSEVLSRLRDRQNRAEVPVEESVQFMAIRRQNRGPGKKVQEAEKALQALPL